MNTEKTRQKTEEYLSGLSFGEKVHVAGIGYEARYNGRDLKGQRIFKGRSTSDNSEITLRIDDSALVRFSGELCIYNPQPDSFKITRIRLS